MKPLRHNPTSPAIEESAPTMPRAAYVHVPFCRHHCGYCNFTVLAGRDDLTDQYLQAIEREMSWLASPREVDTLFVGGGTPTHLAVDRLERLLASIRRWFLLADEHEFSVEANPSDITAEKAQLLAEHGVTRVSLGAQSFDDAKLASLERDHQAADIRRAVAHLQEERLDVSIDLIFGAPGENLDVWNHDLQAAIELQPDHISTYGLTYEKGTAFWNRLQHGELRAIDEENERAMYLTAIDTLSASGLEHYEVSNFARQGHRCRHNEVYWAGKEYYAVGPGAARYVNGRRETNHRSTTAWLARVAAGRSPVAESETLGDEDRAREALVLALRRIEGVDRREFEARTGFELEGLAGKVLSDLVARGLLADDGQQVRLTREGLLVSDAIWPHLLRA